MKVIGTGFIARHLDRIAHRHPQVVALAAGVSHVVPADAAADFAREERLVRATARACRETGSTLVYFSTASAGVYGGPHCSGRENCPHPSSPYGHHKLSMEQLVSTSGCDWLILRLSHLVGPDQSAHQLVPQLVRQVEHGSVRIFPDTRRDVLDVAHFVRIVDELLTASVSGSVVNVASGEAVPVDDLVTYIADMLKCAPRREYAGTSRDHRVSVGKLRGLLSGERPGQRFADDYRVVLDHYVPHYATAHSARAASW